MWLEIVYKPTSLFSLKQSNATNSAAKTLLCPSPYAVKMALLNAIITYDSVEIAKKYFNSIKELEMQFYLPNEVVVSNCFVKILKEKRSESRVNEWDTYQSTVAFREYAHLNEDLKIAINISEIKSENIEMFKKWFMRINYFGKRGCFFQFTKTVETEILPLGYSQNLGSEIPRLTSSNIMLLMDDFGKKDTFDKVNTYSLDKTDRSPKIFLFPYQIVKSNKNFTLYRRIL
jgi:hypothetical protein